MNTYHHVDNVIHEKRIFYKNTYFIEHLNALDSSRMHWIQVECIGFK
jgi:hypothetical protein